MLTGVLPKGSSCSASACGWVGSIPDAEVVAPASYLAAVAKVKLLRRITLGIIAYLILALAWWSVLLHTKNNDAFQAKVALLELRLLALEEVSDNATLQTHPAYVELEREYRNQGYMIIGEALVLVLSLVAAIYFVNRSYRKEVLAAKQQRNFLLSITHELKSPLAGIQLALETMRRRVLPEPTRAHPHRQRPGRNRPPDQSR